jgi:uncharacterized membrane protein YjdF
MLILSSIDPVAVRNTWFLEILPAMIGLLLLSLTWQRFPLSLLLNQLQARLGAL